MHQRIVSLFCVLLAPCCCLGATAVTALNAFNAGELSPYLDARTDVEKYYSGCKTLTNFLVRPFGGIVKRSGTYHIAEVKNSADTVRLIPFVYSTDDAFVLELGDEYMRFYHRDAAVANPGDLVAPYDPYEIVTPWTDAELSRLKFAGVGNVMYFVEPNTAPQRLERLSSGTWTIADANIERGPFLTSNTQPIFITPSATTGNITLTADANVWTAQNVGSLWRLIITMDANENDDGDQFTDGRAYVCYPIRVMPGQQLVYRITMGDHGSCQGVLERSRATDANDWVHEKLDDDDNWDDIVTFDLGNDETTPGTLTNESDYPYYYRFNLSYAYAGNCHLQTVGYAVEGVARITAYSTEKSVSAVVAEELGGTTPTRDWAEGAFSARRGFPRAVAFYQQRLVFGGTAYEPQKLWFSMSDDHLDFHPGADDDDAFATQIVGDTANPILWLMASSGLFVGTSASEWLIHSTADTPLTPSKVPLATRNTSYGSADIQPVATGTGIAFVQNTAKRIRVMQYSVTQDAYVGQDASLMSEHLFRSPITAFACQAQPDNILWCVRQDGDIAALTSQGENNVSAWTHHTVSGDVASLCSIPYDGQDEVWLLVARTISGSTRRQVEVFRPQDYGDDPNDAYYVDAGLTWDGGAPLALRTLTRQASGSVTFLTNVFDNGDLVEFQDVGGMVEIERKVLMLKDKTVEVGGVTYYLYDPTGTFHWNTSSYSAYTSGGTAQRVARSFSGLSYLEGQTVCGLADGSYQGTATVTAGTASFTKWHTHWHVGLPYTSTMQTMRLNVPGSNAVQGFNQRLVAVTPRFYETGYARVGYDAASMEAVNFRQVDDPVYEMTPLFTGEKRVQISSGWNKYLYLYVDSERPQPLNLLSLIVEWEVAGR